MADIPNNWQVLDNKLHRQFIFKDFLVAFAFMVKVAILAEKQDHHPTWQNSYKTVDIYLSTHDAGNIITSKDIKLADSINKLL